MPVRCYGLRRLRCTWTYATAAHEGDYERLDPSCSSDDPDETNEEDDAEDILDTWKVDSKHRSQFLASKNRGKQDSELFEVIRRLL